MAGLCSLDAGAAVFKCASPNGIVYSDRPCGSNSKVVVAEPASKSGSNAPVNVEALDWKKICGTENKEACVAAHRQSDEFERDGGVRKIDSTLPIQLLLGLQSSCKQNDPPALFSLHSKRVAKLLLSEDPTRQRQIFARYCTQLRETMAHMKGGNPANATYFMKQTPPAKNGDAKSILCIVPDSASRANCDLQLDVVTEGDAMKKDEL